MERLPNRYPKISQSHKVPLYKGLSLFYPKLQKNVGKQHVRTKIVVSLLRGRRNSKALILQDNNYSCFVRRECTTRSDSMCEQPEQNILQDKTF